MPVTSCPKSPGGTTTSHSVARASRSSGSRVLASYSPRRPQLFTARAASAPWPDRRSLSFMIISVPLRWPADQAHRPPRGWPCERHLCPPVSCRACHSGLVFWTLVRGTDDRPTSTASHFLAGGWEGDDDGHLRADSWRRRCRMVLAPGRACATAARP